MQDLATTFMSMAIAVIISIKYYFHRLSSNPFSYGLSNNWWLIQWWGSESQSLHCSYIKRLFLYSSNLKVDSTHFPHLSLLLAPYFLCVINLFYFKIPLGKLYLLQLLYQKLGQTLIILFDWMCGCRETNIGITEKMK